MSIITIYQFAFLASVITVVALAAFAARRQRVVQPNLKAASRVPLVPSIDEIVRGVSALDLLFDQNKLSVEEYVELRRRVTGSTPQPR